MLKSFIGKECGFIYLKWLVNKINFIEHLKFIVKTDVLVKRQNELIENVLFDADWIRQYFLADSMANLIKFDFYICFEHRLSFDQINTLINSFKIHSFFVNRQWTNIKFLFDQIKSCSHLFSSFHEQTNSNCLTLVLLFIR